MCDHVLACTHLCRRPFVTICCVGVSAERLVLQHSIWGFFICWHTHMCITESRSSWSQFPFAGLVYVSSSAPVHVGQIKQSIIRCHGSRDGDCEDMSFEF